MKRDIVIDDYQNIYENGYEDTVKKCIAIAALSAFLSSTPKIQAATYTPNQIVLKVNEIDNCFDIQSYTSTFLNSNERENIADISFETQNLNVISSKIDIEFNRFSKYIEKDISEARIEVNNVATEIANIKFKNIAVELTPSNTIKFTLTFDDKKLLMLTYPFDKIEGIPEEEVLFSFFIDRNLIVSDSLKLNDLVIGINNYLLV